MTPLHIAAVWGCYQNLKMLLMNGGDPSIKDNVRILISMNYVCTFYIEKVGVGDIALK